MLLYMFSLDATAGFEYELRVCNGYLTYPAFI